MTKSSPQKQAGQKKIDRLKGSQQDIGNVSSKRPTIIQFASGQRLERRDWSLKVKATVWSCIISMLPVLTVGATTYCIGNQLISEQIPNAKQLSTKDLTETKLALQKQLSLLLIGTGGTTLLVGAIAASLANRAIRPLVNAAALSNNIVHRLLPENVSTRAAIASKDELVVLEKNISLIKKQLPDLLWKQEFEAEHVQVLMNITRRIHEFLNEEDVLKTTVEEVRTALSTDRVTIFRFNPNGEGTFVAESVAFGLPKTLWATVSDPCFEEGYVEKYQNGRIVAIDDIYQTDLTDCHIALLERFAVKANLVAPILKKDQLFGLLIAHECSKPRFWQQSEIDLFAQIATQVGFVLNYTSLIDQIDTKNDQTQTFVDIIRRIRESLNEEDVLKTTVEEVRKAISADRVLVYDFDADWYGTVIAESVLPGFPKALRAKIKDPCFVEGYVERYQAGRVQATNNIYEAGLTECHINQLEPFAVKANLVAPILKDDQLFGLLIAHQCSAPRNWRQSEIDLFAQIAMQAGFALDHARLLQRIDAESVRTHLQADLTRRIRESLNEEDVLKTTVEEVRKAISTDRVLVYGFDADWYGTVIAESVLPGFPKALWAKIKDPCFVEGYVEKYQAGRVEATNNIYEAGLTRCHINQLEPFAVKANLVAPILKDDQLFGLLIAHQCSAPRDWQQSEIDLFAQIAMQVGFALDHARLLNQVDQAYQAAEASSVQQSQKQEQIRIQVSELLKSSNTVVQTFSTGVALEQMQCINSIYNQIQLLGDSAQEMIISAQRIELQEQQLSQRVQDENVSINRILNSICTIQQTVVEAAAKVNCIEKPSQKLSEIVSLMSNVVSQMKLQAMHTALEASRAGEASQPFAEIAQKMLSLVQQLDSDIAEVQPLVAQIQTESHEIIAAIESKAEYAKSSTELIEETQQQLNEMIAISNQMKTLVAEIAQAAAVQAQTSTSANESILGVATIANQTSEQALAMAESLAQLAIFAQDF
ncbi:GAF domain-containing protein [Nostoc sp. 106C]|uniref:GAF domain-containing protein n=1 Tax=Nostoc sp. 106C TaxID=1932667 RepID=UPI000A397C82|nr:GAF domain-containing protein [Nostoc sp. 106C]OUL17711.1 chemotaxis protein [Nostoc sp. 106C]